MSWEPLSLVTELAEHYEWVYSDAASSVGTIGGRSLSDFFLVKVNSFFLDPNVNNTNRAWLGCLIQVCEFYPSFFSGGGYTEGNSIFYSPSPPVQEVMLGPHQTNLVFTGDMPRAREMRIPYNVKPGSPLQGRIIGCRILSKQQKKAFYGFTETNILNANEKTFKGRIGYKVPYDDRLNFQLYHWCEPLTLAARKNTADLLPLQEEIFNILGEDPQTLADIVAIHQGQGGVAGIRDVAGTLQELADLGLARKVDDESGVYWARDV